MTMDYAEDPGGFHNAAADAVVRVDSTWSDGDLMRQQFTKPFERLKCRFCTSISFQVMITESYETSARCEGCGAWYIVHTG